MICDSCRQNTKIKIIAYEGLVCFLPFLALFLIFNILFVKLFFPKSQSSFDKIKEKKKKKKKKK